MGGNSILDHFKNHFKGCLKDLKLSHGIFFYYFKSKQEIMKEVIYEDLNEIKSLLKQIIEDNEICAPKKISNSTQMVCRCTRNT